MWYAILGFFAFLFGFISASLFAARQCDGEGDQLQEEIANLMRMKDRLITQYLNLQEDVARLRIEKAALHKVEE
jgi:hypothetical protein